MARVHEMNSSSYKSESGISPQSHVKNRLYGDYVVFLHREIELI